MLSPALDPAVAGGPPAAVGVLDAQGHLTWANRAMVDLLGRPLDTLRGEGWRRCLQPHDVPRVIALWRRGSEERKPIAFQVQLRDASARDRWIRAEAIPVPGGSDLVHAWIVVGFEVEPGPLPAPAVATAAATTDARLADLVFGAAPIGIEVFGPDGTATAINAAQLALVGLPPDTAVVGKFNPLTDPLAAPARETFLRAYGGETVDSEFEVPLGDGMLNAWGSSRGTITVRQTLVPVMGASGGVDAVIAFVRDVTAERERADEAHAAGRRLADADHAQRLTTLAGGVAHDFNNLLAAIMGHAALAAEQLPADSPVQADLRAVEAASRRAATLAQQLLAYSGGGRLVTELVAVGSLVRTVAGRLAPRLRGCDLTLDLAPSPCTVRGDASQLTDVVLNLVLNALEAIPAGRAGRILVRTQETRDGDGNRHVRLVVTDSGCGMDAPTRERLFEPFFSTKAPGRGLGMAAVKGIVEGHGGRLEVMTAPDEGTTVEVLLPGVAAAPRPRAAAAGSGSSRPVVLVVEDDGLIARLVERTLARGGFDSRVAADGSTAIGRLRDPGEAIDAVLLDLTLPDMGGRSVAEVARAARPGLPVVVSTGWTSAEARAEVRGCVAVLEKPYHPDELLGALRRALAEAGSAA